MQLPAPVMASRQETSYSPELPWIQAEPSPEATFFLSVFLCVILLLTLPYRFHTVNENTPSLYLPSNPHLRRGWFPGRRAQDDALVQESTLHKGVQGTTRASRGPFSSSAFNHKLFLLVKTVDNIILLSSSLYQNIA